MRPFRPYVLTGLLLWPAFGGGLAAQEPEPLSLERALVVARQNNPGYLAARNDEGPADWAVRSAYGQFLPRASVSGGVRYEDEGSALFGSLTAEDIGFSRTPSYYFSSYSAGVSLSLSGETFFNLAQQRADRRAVLADIEATEVTLDLTVKQAYVAALGARELVELRRQVLERATENLTLAETRAAAGVAIPLDVKQAQVERGRAQVELLTAETEAEAAEWQLLEQLGLEIDQDVVLTTEPVVFDPPWSRETLLALAAQQHPLLASLAATAAAQRAAQRTAWSSYLPTVVASAGLSGFTRQVGDEEFLFSQAQGDLENDLESCQSFNELNARLADPYPMEDCSQYQPTPSRLDSLRSLVQINNRGFPFDFQQQPLTLSVGVSLPVFTGFTRQRDIAQAAAQADDAEHRLREQRLRLTTSVAQSHLRLETAYQAVQLERTNRTVAAEQLEQARERYRVGLESFIGLTEAETLASQADQAYLAAVYAFQNALAQLEAAVGAPLRSGAEDVGPGEVES